MKPGALQPAVVVLVLQRVAGLLDAAARDLPVDHASAADRRGPRVGDNPVDAGLDAVEPASFSYSASQTPVSPIRATLLCRPAAAVAGTAHWPPGSRARMRLELARSIPAAVAVAVLLSPLGAATASAAAAPVTGSVDQPLDYGPPGTVPTGRIAPPPSDAEQQAVLSRPVTPADQPRLVPYFYP